MKYIVLAFALMATGPAMAQTTPPAAPPAAATALTPTPDDRAKQWLTLLDDANYADGYKQLAAGATRATPFERWSQKVVADRAPLGAMSARNIKDVKMTKTLPGMRSGQYATVRYDSTFAHKAAAVETVVLVSEKGGWSVIDYHIE